jgi:hypothetical protein
MALTAIDEQRGGSVDVTIGTAGIYRCRLETGPGGARLYVIRPTVVGVIVQMPDPARSTCGTAPNVVLINKGTQTLTVTNYAGTTIGTIAASNAWEIWLPIAGDDTWLPIGPFPVSSSGTLNATRKVFDVTYTASSTARTNVRTDVAKQYGYIGQDGPVAVNVLVKAGVVLGGGTAGNASFATGAWPSGSTMVITLESGAYIAGAGGAGGSGFLANSSGGTAGGAGGDAMSVRVNASLINYGTIQGGGGGGGGGAARIVSSVATQGGSGGGGAGANPGAGGPIIQSAATTAGSAGSLTAGGSGGVLGAGAAGGTGGAPGTAGNAGQSGTTSGQAGGAAGVAIAVQTSAGYSLTKLVAGTILGSETTF